MIRGRVWAIYLTDDLGEYALEVDADYAADPARGFDVPAPSTLVPLPRGWLPRKVIGIEPSGATHAAVVGSPTAPLWSGLVTHFNIEATDGTTITCEVFDRKPEWTSRRP